MALRVKQEPGAMPLRLVLRVKQELGPRLALEENRVRGELATMFPSVRKLVAV